MIEYGHASQIQFGKRCGGGAGGGGGRAFKPGGGVGVVLVGRFGAVDLRYFESFFGGVSYSNC